MPTLSVIVLLYQNGESNILTKKSFNDKIN